MTAAARVAEHREINTHELHAEVLERLRLTFVEEDCAALRRYMAKVVRSGHSIALENSPAAAQFLDASNAAPPVLACRAFQGEDGCEEYTHPIERLFEVSAFTDPTKQLEHCGCAFNRFRALYELPVVPHGMTVKNAGDDVEWFEKLYFGKAIATDDNVCTDSLFTVTGRDRQVVRTSFHVTPGKYYFPSVSNHPLIDRAVVAKTSAGDHCLVLHQDKVNGASIRTAVRKITQEQTAPLAAAFAKPNNQIRTDTDRYGQIRTDTDR